MRSAPAQLDDYQTPGRCDEALALRAKGWANIDKGWKLYESLPQSAEEGELWKRFVAEWNGWKSAEQKVPATKQGSCCKR